MIHKNRPWFVIFLCSINKFLHLFLISVFDQKTFGLPRQSFKPKNHLHSAPAFSSPDPSYPFPSVSECFFSPENARPGWGCHASDVTRFTLVLPPSSPAANSMPPACCIYLVRVTPLSIPKKGQPRLGLAFFGASDVTRTRDLLITSEMHYRLCYTGRYLARSLYLQSGQMSISF